MAKEDNQTAKPATSAKPVDTQKIALEINVPTPAARVTCEVCGHQNAQDAGICAMCSNYLFH